MVTEIQEDDGFTRTLGIVKASIWKTLLQFLATHQNITSIFTRNTLTSMR